MSWTAYAIDPTFERIPVHDEMILVPEGVALSMNASGHGARLEVLLPAFYIDRYETTVREYNACVERASCAPLDKVQFRSQMNSPEIAAAGMRFRDAQAYCAFRGKRLPTHFEWEKAARGPTGFVYACSNTLRFGDANILWGADSTSPVPKIAAPGSFPRDVSPYGVYDMVGNVSEYIAQETTQKKPSVRTSTSFLKRLHPTTTHAQSNASLMDYKGGSVNDFPANAQHGTRRRTHPRQRGMHPIGIRCALSAPSP